MTNLADVTLFFNAVWAASPLQGEGEGCLHGNVCIRLRTPHLRPLPFVQGERRKGQTEYNANLVCERINCGANKGFAVGNVGNPNGRASTQRPETSAGKMGVRIAPTSSF